MSTARTPLRHAKAAALYNHLVGRRSCIELFLSRLPDDEQDEAREILAQASGLTGMYGALFMLGGHAGDTGLDTKVYEGWMNIFNDLDALNVTAVSRHLTTEAGWKARDVETALNDLADDEAIRLVAESDSGEVAIELLRRPGER